MNDNAQDQVPFLSIENLHVAFRNFKGFKEILHGINLHVASGEAVAIVGESGSGKSVTAQAVMGLLGTSAKVTEGQIFFKQKPIHQATEKQMNAIRGKKIGMVFQDPMTSLNPTMTIGKQIAETLILHDGISFTFAKQKTIELLEIVGMSQANLRFGTYPFELSGGMRQRVMIAMAIACRPELLIADEPTTALDTGLQSQILNLLKDLIRNYNMSLLFITHDLNIASNLCSRVAIMHEGTIVETGPINTVFSSPKHSYTCSLLENRYFRKPCYAT